MDSRNNKRHHQHTYISASDETSQREAQGRGASWAAAHMQSSEVIVMAIRPSRMAASQHRWRHMAGAGGRAAAVVYISSVMVVYKWCVIGSRQRTWKENSNWQTMKRLKKKEGLFEQNRLPCPWLEGVNSTTETTFGGRDLCYEVPW